MQITSLTIHNVGIIDNFKLKQPRPLNLFYGDIKQGKTTILNAIRWAFGGEYPADLMRHGQTEAWVQIEADDDGCALLIRREWFLNKEGVCTNRPLVFKRNGVDQPRPSETLKRFLNPFIMDDRYFVDMTPLEKGRFLCRMFNMDTRAEDKAIGEKSEEASQLRVTIKGYGEIIPVEVSPVDPAKLIERRRAVVEEHAKLRAVAVAEKDAITAKHDAACQAVRDAHAEAVRKVAETNSLATAANVQRQKAVDMLGKRQNAATTIECEIAALEEQLAAKRAALTEAQQAVARANAWILAHPQQDLVAEPSQPAMPTAPDVSAIQARVDALPETEEIDTAIQRAGAINEQHKAFLKDKARLDAKTADESHLLELEREQAALKQEKVAKLAKIGAESGIPTLVFLDGGDFEFDGTSSAMLSDSQNMLLTEHLKGKYPEGFNISLVDRGESLGKSVMTLVKRAEEKHTTIFCSVVGERPAVVPDDVGAFVVEKGKVMA